MYNIEEVHAELVLLISDRGRHPGAPIAVHLGRPELLCKAKYRQNLLRCQLLCLFRKGAYYPCRRAPVLHIFGHL